MFDSSVLDNPIWHSLTSGHKSMALLNGMAARYPADVAPFAGLSELTPPAFADLRQLVKPEEKVVLFTTGPVDLPAGWQMDRSFVIDQMVCTRPTPPPSGSALSYLPMGDDDIPDMLALTAATEPGPFFPRAITMGRYLGIRSPEGRLAALSGERFSPHNFTEISAVCTDPDFRGKGYASYLIAHLIAMLQSQGRTPFLHVKTENGAKRVYEKLGFEFRMDTHVSIIMPVV